MNLYTLIDAEKHEWQTLVTFHSSSRSGGWKAPSSHSPAARSPRHGTSGLFPQRGTRVNAAWDKAQGLTH
jgi:hypothetical protein